MVPGRYENERFRQRVFLGGCSPDVAGTFCVTPESAPYEEHPRRSMVKSVQAQENYHWMACQQEQLDELDDMFRRYKHRCGRGRKTAADEPGLSSRIDTRLSLTSFDEADENLEEVPPSQHHHHQRHNSAPRLPSSGTPSTKAALQKKDLENSPFMGGKIYSPVEDDDVLKEALVAAQNVMEDKKSTEVALLNRPSSGASGGSMWSEEVRNSARSVRSYREDYGGHGRSDWADEWEYGGDTSRSARSTLMGSDRRHAYHRSEMVARGGDIYERHHHVQEDVFLLSNTMELEAYARSSKKRHEVSAMSEMTKPRGPRKPDSQTEQRTTRRYSSSVYTTSTPPSTPKKKGGPGVPVTMAIKTPLRSSSMVGRMGHSSKKADLVTPKRVSSLRESGQSSRKGTVGSQPYESAPRLVSKTASFETKSTTRMVGKYGPPQRQSKYDSTEVNGVPYTRQPRGSASKYGPPQRLRDGGREDAVTLKPRSGISQHRVGLGSAGVKVRQQAGFSNLRT